MNRLTSFLLLALLLADCGGESSSSPGGALVKTRLTEETGEVRRPSR